MGFAVSAPQLLILRLFQGSLAGFMAPAIALMACCAPENRTGQALGTLQFSIVSGMIVGPLLGGVLSHLTGLVFGIAGVANACCAPFWGKSSDRTGSRRLLSRALAGITLFSLPQVFVTSVSQLMILHAGVGLFFSGIIPTINTIVRSGAPEKDRGAIFGIFQGGLLKGSGDFGAPGSKY
jgi:MFS family permease